MWQGRRGRGGAAPGQDNDAVLLVRYRPREVGHPGPTQRLALSQPHLKLRRRAPRELPAVSRAAQACGCTGAAKKEGGVRVREREREREKERESELDRESERNSTTVCG